MTYRSVKVVIIHKPFLGKSLMSFQLAWRPSNDFKTIFLKVLWPNPKTCHHKYTKDLFHIACSINDSKEVGTDIQNVGLNDLPRFVDSW